MRLQVISIFFHDCEVALTSHICYPIRLSVSSASEFTHSLSWHPTRTFKPHTRAISTLAIVVIVLSSHVHTRLLFATKKNSFLRFFSLKPVLIRNKRYQCKLVCTGPMNEWCKILTIKTLTELNRT